MRQRISVLQVKTMKEIIRGIKQNPLHLSLGIITFLVSLRICFSPHYFVWPPEFVPFLHADVIGIVGMIIGIALIVYTVINKPNPTANTWILSLDAGLMALLAVLGIGHDFFAYPRVSGYLEAFVVVIVFYTARHSNYLEYQKRKK